MLLNTRAIQLMNAFESITHAQAMDCFEAEDCIAFLIKEGDLGKAIGKGGVTINDARSKFGKRVVVFEDSDTPRTLIEKACSPVKVSPIISEGSVVIEAHRNQRDEITGKQIRLIKELVKRKLGIHSVEFTFV